MDLQSLLNNTGFLGNAARAMSGRTRQIDAQEQAALGQQTRQQQGSAVTQKEADQQRQQAKLAEALRARRAALDE